MIVEKIIKQCVLNFGLTVKSNKIIQKVSMKIGNICKAKPGSNVQSQDKIIIITRQKGHNFTKIKIYYGHHQTNRTKTSTRFSKEVWQIWGSWFYTLGKASLRVDWSSKLRKNQHDISIKSLLLTQWSMPSSERKGIGLKSFRVKRFVWFFCDGLIKKKN